MARQSLAERFRANRENFELALELGCTPIEAGAELARRRARLRWLAAEQRREQAMESPPRLRAQGERAEQLEPWWTRD